MTALLTAALLAQMTLPNGHYVVQCRRARGGCEQRCARLAAIFERAGTDAGVDPWLVAAVAMHESALTPGIVGDAGEHGIMQLHPRSRAGIEAARQCRVAPSDCEAIEVEIAARVLASAIARCGSEASGLVAYNTGECGAPTAYARNVLRLREEMRR